MIYLQSFHMLSQEEDQNFFDVKSPTFKTKNYRTCYSSRYPFVMFRERGLPDFKFDDITIFYGDNGSGKSTILNVIAEKLKLNRGTPLTAAIFLMIIRHYVILTLPRFFLPTAKSSQAMMCSIRFLTFVV